MAALLALLIQALLLLPLAYAGWRAWEQLARVAAIYCAGFLGMLAIATAASPGPTSLTLPADALTAVNGGISAPDNGNAESLGRGPAPGAVGQCAEAIRMSQRIDLFDLPVDGVLPVNAQIWEQLPARARAGLLQCVSNELGGGEPLKAEPR